MRRKLLTFIVALMLVVATIIPLPNMVEAQEAISGKNRIRVATVVGVGITQTLNLYYLNVHTVGLPAAPHPSEPGVPGVIVVLQNPNPNTGPERVCTQTIPILVNPILGLNTLTFKITSGEDKELLVNGGFKETLDNCFDNTNRVVYVIGEVMGIEPNISQPAMLRRNDLGLFTLDISDSDGATAATVGLDLPQKFLVFENRD